MVAEVNLGEVAEPVKPSKSLLSAAGRAIGDYTMIREGDRVLLGLSGGKDSMALLHVLLALQKKAPIRFELAACTVDPQSSAFDPSPLKPYMASLGVRYFYESQPIVEEAKKTLKEGDSYCAYCSRMRRGILYRVARENGYNVLALAQHLDDLAETFLMSAFFGGKLRTMKPNYLNDVGDVRVIRPFAYVRERQTAAFAKSANLPVIPDNCPACFGDGSERAHMKQMLAQLEKANTKLFPSLLRAMRPLMDDVEMPLQQAKPVTD
jgi:tRNA 2-thiocytidine biosynthesis protein TtcA